MPERAKPYLLIPEFLAGGGEMGERMRGVDWASTPLGPAASWPQSLKTCVRIMLTSRQPMFVWWGGELINLYNDAYRSILGGKHPDALGQPASFVWREIWNQIEPRAASAMTGNEGTYDEALLLIMERYGYPEETYYTFSYSPVPNDQGGPGGILCANTDDTQRIIGERQLALLRHLAAGVADARTIEDACRLGARSLETNPRDLPFALLYLVEPDERHVHLAGSAGIPPGHGAAPDTVSLGDDAVWPIAEAIRGNAPFLLQGVPRSLASLPTGAWDKPPSQVVVAPIRPQGEMARTGVLIAGLNPYRLFDDSYQRLLSLITGQLAAAIVNAQAYEAERRRAEALAEIDRAKTTFFSNASHEFRTPLTLMLGPLEDILGQARTGDAVSVTRRDVELIHRNGLRLLKLVNTLLDFSRIEAGRIEAVFEPVDLAGFSTDLASSFRSAMERAGLDYTVDCRPLPAPVHIDRDMWEKIVLNLVSNAFKYTLNGSVSVSLHATADGKSAELIVGDTGIGIPEHELPRLFERFHRIEGQQGRTQEGTGIGLALVQELAKIHGGTVRAESAVGRGTSISVTIPLGRAHLPTESVHQPRSASTGVRAEAFVAEALRWLPDEAPSDEPAIEKELIGAALATALLPLERARVVLADDNADMRDYVRRLLAPHYEVEAVGDGQAALEAVRRRRPDLLLSDVMMPKLDGFELLRVLRADPQLADLPVVLLSARAGEEAGVEGLEAGADDYLTKPFSARELVARVRTNLHMARLRRQTQEELRRLNETLEQRVAAEIERRLGVEEAFRQSQKMEAIGQLTGGIAHDFNNLLQVILGNLDSLRRRVSGPHAANLDVQRSIDSAMRGAERAAMLTHQLLAFSRRQPLEPKPTDASKLVTGMAELLRRTLGETITIETNFGGGLWPIAADTNQLENALLNLAVNARDAMPEGGKLIIETANTHLDEAHAADHEQMRPGQYVTIAVSDTGCGMTKDVMARAFDPFFTTKGIGQGTGLGLSQVYGFVTQSGGHVKLHSVPGAGTTVRLYLPRAAGEITDEGALEAQRSPDRGRGETILVVEDDEDVRAYSTEMLRELGYSVLQASDGPAALAALAAAPCAIRLLFTDIGLPGGLNGRQLAEEACRRHPELRVLLTTGYARDALARDGKLDAGLALITKPFTYVALAAKIRTLLAGGGATRQWPARP